MAVRAINFENVCQEWNSFLHQFNHNFKGDMCRIKVLRSGDEHLIQVTSANITPLMPSMHGILLHTIAPSGPARAHSGARGLDPHGL
jgi:hypothetical protein